MRLQKHNSTEIPGLMSYVLHNPAQNKIDCCSNDTPKGVYKFHYTTSVTPPNSIDPKEVGHVYIYIYNTAIVHQHHLKAGILVQPTRTSGPDPAWPSEQKRSRPRPPRWLAPTRRRLASGLFEGTRFKFTHVGLEGHQQKTEAILVARILAHPLLIARRTRSKSSGTFFFATMVIPHIRHSARI